MSSARSASSVGEETVERSDEELVVATRAGDSRAYAILWERHAAAGRRAARAITSSYDPDDIVSEAFVSILGVIQRGGGPTGPFRPYLFATIRNIAATWGRKSTDMSLDGLSEAAFPGEEPDPLEQLSARSSLASAFKRLPERQRTLLWYLEVEGMKPREIAPLMGLTANAVSALAYRAREGFRQVWLDLHIADPGRPEECRWVCERVLVQGKHPLARPDRGRFGQHLAACRACQIVAADVENAPRRLRAVMLPLVLGGAAATLYLADSTPAVAAATAALGAEAAAGSGIPVVTSSLGEGTNIFSGAAAVAVEPTKNLGVGIGFGAALTATAAATAVAIFVASASWAPTEVTAADAPAVVAPQRAVEDAPTLPVVAPVASPTSVPTDDADDTAAPAAPAVPAQPAPSPVSTPPPPPPVDDTPPASVFRLTGVHDLTAPVPSPFEGTATPGATVAILDENDVVLVETIVAQDGTFTVDVSGDLLHQGMTVRARQWNALGETPEFTEPLGPFVFPVPTLTGSAPGGNFAAADSDGDGDHDDALIELNGLAAEFVSLRMGDGEGSFVLGLGDTPLSAAMTNVGLGHHAVIVRYIDAATGRTGLASPQQVVVVAADVTDQ